MGCFLSLWHSCLPAIVVLYPPPSRIVCKEPNARLPRLPCGSWRDAQLLALQRSFSFTSLVLCSRARPLMLNAQSKNQTGGLWIKPVLPRRCLSRTNLHDHEGHGTVQGFMPMVLHASPAPLLPPHVTNKLVQTQACAPIPESRFRSSPFLNLISVSLPRTPCWLLLCSSTYRLGGGGHRIGRCPNSPKAERPGPCSFEPSEDDDEADPSPCLPQSRVRTPRARRREPFVDLIP